MAVYNKDVRKKQNLSSVFMSKLNHPELVPQLV